MPTARVVATKQCTFLFFPSYIAQTKPRTNFSRLCSSGGWKRILGLTVFSVPVIGTAYLGTWQLQRYFWKIGQIQDAKDSLAAAPVDPPKDGHWDALRTRRVQAEGRFEPEKTMFVGPRSPPARYVLVCLFVGLPVDMPFHTLAIKTRLSWNRRPNIPKNA
jgi:hypothetical protein